MMSLPRLRVLISRLCKEFNNSCTVNWALQAHSGPAALFLRPSLFR